MTLTIELGPEEEARLMAAARRAGLAPAVVAQKVLAEHLPLFPEDGTAEDPTLALFAQWDQEAAQMTPEEVQAAQQEFEEFKQSMNAERARAGSRVLYQS